MEIKIVKTALLYTLIVHLCLLIIFMSGFIFKKEKYGDNYINEGIYFNFQFLQFFPITFIVFLLIISVYYQFRRRRKSKN